MKDVVMSCVICLCSGCFVTGRDKCGIYVGLVNVRPKVAMMMMLLFL